MLDPIVAEAIRDAVRSAGQPAVVADRLLHWLGQAAIGSESLTDYGSSAKRIEDLLKHVQTDDFSTDDEDAA